MYYLATRDIDPLLFKGWPAVFDVGPTIKQQWINVSCLLGYNTVDLVIFACLNFREFLISRLFTISKICEFSFFFSSAITVIIFARFLFVLLAEFAKIKISRILPELQYIFDIVLVGTHGCGSTGLKSQCLWLICLLLLLNDRIAIMLDASRVQVLLIFNCTNITIKLHCISYDRFVMGVLSRAQHSNINVLVNTLPTIGSNSLVTRTWNSLEQYYNHPHTIRVNGYILSCKPSILPHRA